MNKVVAFITILLLLTLLACSGITVDTDKMKIEYEAGYAAGYVTGYSQGFVDGIATSNKTLEIK